MAGSIPVVQPSFAQWDNRAAPSRADLLQQRVPEAGRHIPSRDGTAVDVDDNDSGFERLSGAHAGRRAPLVGGAGGGFSEEPSPSTTGLGEAVIRPRRREGLDEADDALQAALSDAAAAAVAQRARRRARARVAAGRRSLLNEARRASAIEAEDDMLRKKRRRRRRATGNLEPAPLPPRGAQRRLGLRLRRLRVAAMRRLLK